MAKDKTKTEQVRIIFVTPKHGALMTLVGKMVTTVTSSPYSHVAMELNGGIFEAIMPEVTISPANKYDEGKYLTKEILSLPVTPMEKQMIEAEANLICMSDNKYSIKGCIVAAVRTLFGIGAGQWLAKKINCSGMMCAEAVTVALREARPYLCGDVAAELVTPACLYAALRIEGAR